MSLRKNWHCISIGPLVQETIYALRCHKQQAQALHASVISTSVKSQSDSIRLQIIFEPNFFNEYFGTINFN